MNETKAFGKVRSNSIGIRIEFKFLIDRAIRSWISFIFIWIRSVLLIAQSRRPNFYRIRNLLIHLQDLAIAAMPRQLLHIIPFGPDLGSNEKRHEFQYLFSEFFFQYPFLIRFDSRSVSFLSLFFFFFSLIRTRNSIISLRMDIAGFFFKFYFIIIIFFFNTTFIGIGNRIFSIALYELCSKLI